MFTDDDRFERLPVSGNLFFINKKGAIKDCHGNILKKYKNEKGLLVVDLYWIDGYKPYEVAFLILITFRPLHSSVSAWNKVKVEYRDNNSDNLGFENLGWKFPKNGIESEKYPGYFFIPGFTRYVISRSGIVIRTLTGESLKGSIHVSKYIYFTLTPDFQIGRAPNIGLHRLLAFTFLDNGFSVSGLEVNHKNGIPSNNEIENLEWCNRSSNILHAYSMNLRNDNKRVLVTDVNTGECQIFFSAHECERKLGLKRSKVHYRIKFGKGKVYPPGLTFEYLSGTTSRKKEKIPVKLTNTETNEVTTFESMKKCSEAINVSKKVIQKRLKESDVTFFKHFKFEKI